MTEPNTTKHGLWRSAITGKMRTDDPDSILYAILLTSLNGVLCEADGPQCDDCKLIWDAIHERTKGRGRMWDGTPV